MTPNHEEIKRSIREKASGTPENQGKAYLLRSQEFTNRLFFNDHNIPGLELAGTPEELLSTYMADQNFYVNVSNSYWRTVNAVNNDPLLSAKGKEAKKAEAMETAKRKIDGHRALKDFATRSTNLQNAIDSRYSQRREANKPADRHLAYLQQREAREYVQRLCDEARKQGQAPYEVEGIKRDLLAEAVTNYGPETESFISGMLTPPYPVKIISDELKAEIVAGLKKVIAPELSQQREYTVKYEEIFESMAIGCLESIHLEKLSNPYYSLTQPVN